MNRIIVMTLVTFITLASFFISSGEVSALTEKKSKSKVIYGYSHPTMQGWDTSSYRGKYYYKDQEGWRKCVQFRESRHRYGAANSRSSARGAYQFLDSQWRESLVHMITPELKKQLPPEQVNAIKKQLFKNPINKWSREIQDMAFYTVLNYNGKWSGKKHWYLQRSSC